MSIPRNLGNFADNLTSSGTLNVGGINATGTPSSTTVLAGNGSWVTPSAGSYVFISSQTISTAVANVDFTSGFSTTYDNYVILLDGVVCSNNGTLGVRFYKDGVLASSSGYIQEQIKSSGTTVSATAGTGDSYFQVFSGDTVDGGSGQVQGTFTLYSANTTNAAMTFVAIANGPTANSSNKTGVGGGRNTTTGTFTGIRFFWTAGYNFTAGTFKLYGIKKS